MNIGFDLDQTLLNFNKCERESLIEAFITHNILTGRDDERLEHLLNIYAHVSRHHWGQRGEKSVLEVMQLTIYDSLKDFGRTFNEKDIANTYWSFFCSSSFLEPNAVNVLDYLAKNHRLFCMTNGYSETQRGRLKAANIEGYFEGVFISEEIGIAKPNPGSLEFCIKKLQLKKEETIYIGDSLTNDYPAANGAGIHFYFYNPTNIKVEELNGLTEFRNLKELMDFF